MAIVNYQRGMHCLFQALTMKTGDFVGFTGDEMEFDADTTYLGVHLRYAEVINGLYRWT